MSIFSKLGSKIKDRALKAVLENQLKHLSPEQQEGIMAMIEKNPDFFKKIEAEITEAQKKGGNNMYAMMQVMQKHQKEIQQIMQTSGVQQKVIKRG